MTRCAQRVLEARPASAPVASAAVTCWCVGFFHRKYSPDCAKTLVVHVGKTAGGSAVEFLRGNGLLLFAAHMKPVTKFLASAAHVVVTTRDPVDRTASAFLWCAKPSNCHGMQMRSLYDGGCFADAAGRCDAGMFAHALDDASACGRAARAALVSPNASSHIGRGFEYYLGAHLDALSAKRVSVIRMDALEADLRAVLVASGVTPVVEKLAHANIDTGRFVNRAGPINASSRAIMRRHLHKEYAVLSAIFELASRREDPPG